LRSALIIHCHGDNNDAKISRRALAAIIAVAALLPGGAYAAEPLKEIHIDWATYNPVSMILKQKGLLEKEFAKDGIASSGCNRPAPTRRSSSQRRIDRFRLDRGLRGPCRQDQWQPDQVDLCLFAPGMDGSGDGQGFEIAAVADLKGKRVAVTRGTDPHIFLVRALLDAGLGEKDITPVLLQHADGKTALIRGDVDAWAGLDPMMAQSEVEEGARLFFRKPDANTWGILNVREQFLKDYPDVVRRVLATTRRRANIRWRITTT